MKRQWQTKCKEDENTNYSTTSTEWSLLDSDFTETNIGVELVYDQIDLALADMCFSNILIAHSVIQRHHVY